MIANKNVNLVINISKHILLNCQLMQKLFSCVLLVTQNNVKLMFIFTTVRLCNSFQVGKFIFTVNKKNKLKNRHQNDVTGVPLVSLLITLRKLLPTG